MTPRPVGRPRRLRAALIAVAAASLTGCLSTSGPSSARPSAIDLAEQPPGTLPLPATRSELDMELIALAQRLTAAAVARPGDDPSLKDACLRIEALKRHATFKDSFGLSNYSIGALGIAEQECPTDPDSAAGWLDTARQGREPSLPPDFVLPD